MGFGGEVDADRLQDRRVPPAPGELLRLGRVRLLGVPAARRGARREDRGRSNAGCTRTIRRPCRMAQRIGAPAHRPGGPAHDAAGGEPGAAAQGRRCRPAQRPDAHRARHAPSPSADARFAAWTCEGAALYHCGPVALKKGDGWFMNAAGPTTSSREEPYQADIIRRFGVRAVIGKGGMGARTLAALQGARCGLPERDRRRRSVLRECITRRRGGGFPRVRRPGSDVAPPREGLPRHRHDGCAREQPPRGGRKGVGGRDLATVRRAGHRSDGAHSAHRQHTMRRPCTDCLNYRSRRSRPFRTWSSGRRGSTGTRSRSRT